MFSLFSFVFLLLSYLTSSRCPQVSVWLLDKQELSDLGASEKGSVDRVLEVYRRDAQELLKLKLKHPGIVQVIEPLEETESVMAMVTEPVLYSLANVLERSDHSTGVPNPLRSMVSRGCIVVLRIIVLQVRAS